MAALGVNLSNIPRRNLSLYFCDRSGENPWVSPKQWFLFTTLQYDSGEGDHCSDEGWGVKGNERYTWGVNKPLRYRILSKSVIITISNSHHRILDFSNHKPCFSGYALTHY